MAETKETTSYMIGLTAIMPFRSNKDADEVAIAMSELLQENFEILKFDFGTQALDEDKEIEDEVGFNPYDVHVQAEELMFHVDIDGLREEMEYRLAMAGLPKAVVTITERT